MKKFALALMIAGILAGCAVPEKEKRSRTAVVPIREETEIVTVVPMRSAPSSQGASYVASEQFFLCRREDVCPVPRQSFTERFFFPKMPKGIREEPIMKQHEAFKEDLSGPMMATVYFDQADAGLTEAGSKILDGMFDKMKKIDPIQFQIIVAGYTDGSGSKENNAKLAEDRAKTVAYYLIEKGISEERITVGGRPLCCYIAPNDNEEGRAKNRRAEVFVEPLEEGKK